MRRVKLILAVAAMMAISVVGSAPAMASQDYDGWWDSCGWSWSWWWGWFVVCEPDHGSGYDDDVIVDYGDGGGDGGGEGDEEVDLSF